MLVVLCALSVIFSNAIVGLAFTPPSSGSRPMDLALQLVRAIPTTRGKQSPTQLHATAALSPEGGEGTFVIPPEKLKPILKFGEGSKEKIVNFFGLWAMVVSLVTFPIWAAAMAIVNAVCSLNKNLDPNRVVYDMTGKWWAKTWLAACMSYPKVSGDAKRLKEDQGACLFVANHASWLDIPVLCTVLDPVFKFIAKGELRGVPCIGQQLTGGHHILIDREDRRSQLKTFKEGVGWLKKGVPIMAFPEGKRSKDGRLMSFKGGIFSMAVKTNVPLVPISISNTHAIMPSNSLLPVQPGAGKLRVHVHPPIYTEGRTEDELVSMVRESLLSELPMDQQPFPEPEEEVPEVEAAETKIGEEETVVEK